MAISSWQDGFISVVVAAEEQFEQFVDRASIVQRLHVVGVRFEMKVLEFVKEAGKKIVCQSGRCDSCLQVKIFLLCPNNIQTTFCASLH